MWRWWKTNLYELRNFRYRVRIERALALQLRGEARPDGLALAASRSRLEISWRAREIHPWDRVSSSERSSYLFEQQVLDDTEAAICRLFDRIPQIDVIDLRVLDPNSPQVLLSGSVSRSQLRQKRNLKSVRMRLRELGLIFKLPASEF